MKRFRFIEKEKIKNLPKESGVYCFKSKKGVLYIGKAANLRERIKNHFVRPAYKDNLFIDKVEKIGFIKTSSEIEALILEANLIKKINPKYNILWRDDKNYFFVAKTKEDFPRIFWTHQSKPKSRKPKVKIEYIGPFVDGKALKQTLKILRKVFPYRSCRVLPSRPCLWYHLDYCLAPCLLKSKVFNQIPRGILKIKKISQRNARNLMKVLREGKNPVFKYLKKVMKIASKKQDFEEAAKIRDQIEVLEKIFLHARLPVPEAAGFGGQAKIFEIKKLEKEDWKKIEKGLKKILNIKKEVFRVEAYDISNIRGKLATGSMVTFIKGVLNKNFYRKFKIKIEGKPNDIAMIKECLNRRMKHLEWGLPDLILVDGGKAQLNAVSSEIKKIKKKILILALAKRKNELFIERRKKPIPLKNLPNEISNFLLRVRNKAHRFALSYHKKLREKALIPH